MTIQSTTRQSAPGTFYQVPDPAETGILPEPLLSGLQGPALDPHRTALRSYWSAEVTGSPGGLSYGHETREGALAALETLLGYYWAGGQLGGRECDEAALASRPVPAALLSALRAASLADATYVRVQVPDLRKSAVVYRTLAGMRFAFADRTVTLEVTVR